LVGRDCNGARRRRRGRVRKHASTRSVGRKELGRAGRHAVATHSRAVQGGGDLGHVDHHGLDAVAAALNLCHEAGHLVPEGGVIAAGSETKKQAQSITRAL
jgi:hypothetical protein